MADAISILTAPEKFDMFVIAGDFPPGLNTATPPSALEMNETSDGYGYDLAKDGRLAKGTIPSGTARVTGGSPIAWVTGTVYKVNDLRSNGGSNYICATAHTSGTFATDLAAGKWTLITLVWKYGRSWYFEASSTTLRVGAPRYQDVFLPQRSGIVEFNEDSQSIVQIIPFGIDQMLLVKSTGAYIISNITDTRGFLPRTDFVQELRASTATHVTELDGAVFASNAGGLYAIIDGKTQELTRKVRDDVTNFSSVALVVDYEKKRIIGGSTFVYDIATGKLFRYSGSNFRFTSREFHLPDWRPIAVERLIFVIQHEDTEDGNATYQIKFEDGEWGEETNISFPYSEEEFTVVTEDLLERQAVTRFSLRLTDLDSNISIKQIRLDTPTYDLDSYTA